MSGISTRWFLGMAVGGAIALGTNSAVAQIVPDRTLPNNSNVTVNGSTFNITGGTTAGRNLFHSFQQFSVPTGGTASFNNAADIHNIFSRVTGGSVSEINGLIKASGKANLFLINPSGIVFGPSSSLNVGGSFLGTTANAIQFGNFGFFSATNPEVPSPLLTINPSALLFNQIAPSQIQNNSSLSVLDGKSLLLVGGNINMDGGKLNAYGGRVELSGLASPGNVGLNVDGDKLSLGFPNSSTRADISLTNGAGVFVEAGGGGDIAVNSRNLEITSGSALSAGIGQGLGSVDSVAGDITLNATGEIKVVGSGSGVRNLVRSLAVGNGGDINIKTESLAVDGAKIETSTFGQGNAGNLTIAAPEQVSLTNEAFAFTTAESGSVGNAGDLQIQARSVSVTNGSQLKVSTLGRGNSGNLTIDAHNTVEFMNKAFAFSQVQGGGVGNGGEMRISTGSLSVNNSTLSASTIGKGNAGTLRIDARDTVSFTNGGAAFTTVEPGAVGNGNDLRIQARSVLVSNGSFLTANTLGQGNAGNVIIDARDSVQLDNGRVTSRVESPGVGNGGNVTINARDRISLMDGAAIFSGVESQQTAGNGGDISITAGSLSLTNSAQLLASNRGRGNAGNVTINARDSISFDGASVFSSVELPGVGNGGNVTINARDRISFNGSAVFSGVESSEVGNSGDISITAGSLSLTNGAQLYASNRGRGNAGKVTINARDSISFDGASVFSSVESQQTAGNSGDISITTGSLSLTNLAKLYASNHGRGNAGKVTINARDSISFDGASVFSSVESPGVGNGGDISITTGSLFLTNGAQLYASNRGQGGNAGKVTINARNSISFNGGAVFSSVESQQTAGNGGDISITTGSLSLTNLAKLYASNHGRGNAGSVNINARDSISFDGGAVFSSVESLGVGNGGDISITTDSLSLTNGAQLFTTNRGQEGNAGNVTINARDRISFNGASIFSSVESQAVGNDHNTSTTTGSLSLTDGVQMNANNQVQGTAGDIQIRSRSIQLDNQASILARTTSGNGGNITLNSQNFLLLRRNSQISTTAGTAGAGGNGGNITINTPFIVAVKNENSDITANAFSGSGGIVSINATDLFNIAPLSRQDLERLRPNDLDPTKLPTNDITAISQINPSLSGQVTINSLDIDPSRGLITLPTVVEATPKLASSSCAAFNETNGGSQFTITGRGGLPPSPDEPLTSDVVWSDTRLPTTTTQHQHKTHAAKPKPKPIAIVPATGWVFNGNGEVTLISSTHNANSLGTTPATCPAQMSF